MSLCQHVPTVHQISQYTDPRRTLCDDKRRSFNRSPCDCTWRYLSLNGFTLQNSIATIIIISNLERKKKKKKIINFSVHSKFGIFFYTLIKWIHYFSINTWITSKCHEDLQTELSRHHIKFQFHRLHQILSSSAENKGKQDKQLLKQSIPVMLTRLPCSYFPLQNQPTKTFWLLHATLQQNYCTSSCNAVILAWVKMKAIQTGLNLWSLDVYSIIRSLKHISS